MIHDTVRNPQPGSGHVTQEPWKGWFDAGFALAQVMEKRL